VLLASRSLARLSSDLLEIKQQNISVSWRLNLQELFFSDCRTTSAANEAPHLRHNHPGVAQK
jgi:hypothetical protein